MAIETFGVLADERYENLRESRSAVSQARGFLRAVRGESPPPVLEEETMNVQRILNAAYQSAAEGREVATED